MNNFLVFLFLLSFSAINAKYLTNHDESLSVINKNKETDKSSSILTQNNEPEGCKRSDQINEEELCEGKDLEQMDKQIRTQAKSFSEMRKQLHFLPEYFIQPSVKKIESDDTF